MKALILAGGFGSRLAEETTLKPKPMVEIGNFPIIWHIMMIYSFYGINDFIILGGYKSYVIKEYFVNYLVNNSDISIDLKSNEITVHSQQRNSWKITVLDTGLNSGTAGRVRKAKNFLDGDEEFCLTYGDGLSDINVAESIEFHKKNDKSITMTVVNQPTRFGSVILKEKAVVSFEEKPSGVNNLVNGGFFVVNSNVLDLIESDNESWESSILTKLSNKNEVSAFIHNGFWQPMDTLQEKNKLNELWTQGNAPWKVW